MATAPMLDRQFLEKLERLTIHWQKSFPGLVGGHNRSRFPGPGQEFLDHRIFHHGDDLRAVNWRAYLRLEKLFLKISRWSRASQCACCWTPAQSMATGGGAKFDYARKLAAALCYVGLVRLDAIDLHPFSDHLGDALSCCRRPAPLLGPSVDYLQGLEAGGPDRISSRLCASSCPRTAQRGLVIIISDFLDERIAANGRCSTWPISATS